MDDLSIYNPSNLLYNQERMSRYKPGGFHPVCLGDTFKEGRYKICHKLGWGGYSTVSLAWDAVPEMWVSIKIKSADSTEQSRELEALRVLQDTAASVHIVKLFDDFFHQGPNGCHQCLVFELLGPSVNSIAYDYHEGGDQLDAETVLKITTQLLEAIVSMHNVGYAHGDISGSNMAFTCSGLAHVSQDDMFEVLGLPEFEDLARIDGQALEAGVPKQLVKKANWDTWIDEDDEDIRLIDFGEAFIQVSKPDLLAQPADLRAPETIFTDYFDYRIDLWRAGITRPFQHWGGADRLVPQMINFAEGLPGEWQPQWDLMQKAAGRIQENLASMFALAYFAIWVPLKLIELTPGTQVNGEPTQSKLEQKFHDMIQDPVLGPLLPIIRGLTRFRPSDRISAAKALEMIGS